MNTLWGELLKMTPNHLISEATIKKWLKGKRTIRKIKRIPGDASARKYFRIETKEMNFILLSAAPFQNTPKKPYTFLEVQDFLMNCGVSVPQVYDYQSNKGFILLEDLGDQTLLHHLKKISDSEMETRVYQRTLDLLLNFQLETHRQMDKYSLQGFKLRFDHEKLYWEIQFTISHFFEKYLQRKISPAHRKILNKEMSSLCQTLADQPTVYTHRDFHSRNIMVTGSDERLVMIDFQDARMGPAQYDLVSLLRDSYYQLTDAQVSVLTEYYWNQYKAALKPKQGFEEFTRIFDIMTIQRNFKAIGSFASFYNLRGNPSYLKYIGNTFENIRRVLCKYPSFDSLREVLFHYYYF